MKRNATFAYILPTAIRLPHSIIRYQWKAVPTTGLATLLLMRNCERPLSPSSFPEASRCRCNDRPDRIGSVSDAGDSNFRACTNCNRYKSSSLNSRQRAQLRIFPLTSSSASCNRRTANARTLLSVKPGPSNSRASSIPMSCPHSGKSFSTACFASTRSDHVTHFRNLVRDRGVRKRVKRNFHKRSLSRAERDAVGGKRKISCAISACPQNGVLTLSRSRSAGLGFRSLPSSPRR